MRTRFAEKFKERLDTKHGFRMISDSPAPDVLLQRSGNPNTGLRYLAPKRQALVLKMCTLFLRESHYLYTRLGPRRNSSQGVAVHRFMPEIRNLAQKHITEMFGKHRDVLLKESRKMEEKRGYILRLQKYDEQDFTIPQDWMINLDHFLDYFERLFENSGDVIPSWSFFSCVISVLGL